MHKRATLTVSALTLVVVAAFAMLVSGCSASQPKAQPEPAPAEESATPDTSAGMRLAPGLYDMPDGTVQAIGVLEYSDLEGGFWKITGGTEAEGNVGTTVVVISNGKELSAELESLEGKSVIAIGTRLEGASIQMAGPLMTADSVEEIVEMVAPAE